MGPADPELACAALHLAGWALRTARLSALATQPMNGAGTDGHGTSFAVLVIGSGGLQDRGDVTRKLKLQRGASRSLTNTRVYRYQEHAHAPRGPAVAHRPTLLAISLRSTAGALEVCNEPVALDLLVPADPPGTLRE